MTQDRPNIAPTSPKISPRKFKEVSGSLAGMGGVGRHASCMVTFSVVLLIDANDNNHNNHHHHNNNNRRASERHSGQHQQPLGHRRCAKPYNYHPVIPIVVSGNIVQQLGLGPRPCSVYPWMQPLLLLAAVPASPWRDD